MQFKMDSSRRDAPAQLDVILQEIRIHAQNLHAWDWEVNVQKMGPDGEHLYYRILFKPAVWPKVSSPAQEYAALQRAQQEQEQQQQQQPTPGEQQHD